MTTVVTYIKRQSNYSIFFALTILLMFTGIFLKIDLLKYVPGMLISTVYLYLAVKKRKYFGVIPMLVLFYISVVKLFYRPLYSIELYISLFVVVSILLYCTVTRKKSLRIW